MRKNSPSPIFLTTATHFCKNLLFVRGRLLALVVMFLVTSALVVSTGAWAKKKKPQKAKPRLC